MELHDPDCPMTNEREEARTRCICAHAAWAQEDGSHRTVPVGGERCPKCDGEGILDEGDGYGVDSPDCPVCGGLAAPRSSDEWKETHADVSNRALDHELVANAMSEYAGNMGFALNDGLAHYGLMKVASYAAQVARAQALGFDPGLLRVSADEANAVMLARARAAVAAGKPVLRVEGDDVMRMD